jgi:sugar lactone lactonase YvrE
VATDSAGNIYVSDTSNNTIRKIAPDRTVTTIAGNANEGPGSADGKGSDARFNGPSHLALDRSGNIYVADTSNHTIRKIALDGTVTTIAGSPGLRGYANGVGSAARFNLPHGVAVDADGNVFVGDVGNDAVRRIAPNGTVTTVAGGPVPAGKDGNVQASETHFSFGCCGGGLAVDGDGLLYVADRGSQTIRTVTSDGEVSTLAGSGEKGTANGTASEASFNNPIAVATAPNGQVVIADTDNHEIRATVAPAARHRPVRH